MSGTRHDGDMIARCGRVAVLMGGDSTEREISLRSGAAIAAALVRAGVDTVRIDLRGDLYAVMNEHHPERVFVALHGRGGEDGCVQGALRCLGIPFTGSDVLACALAMDKQRAKWVWQNLGLPTPDFRVLAHDTEDFSELESLSYPLAVKPVSEGSSIGVSKVSAQSELKDAFALAGRYDKRILVENWVVGREYTLAIVAGQVLPIIELETSEGWYDYDAKYNSEATRYLCPAPLSAATVARYAKLGLEAFAALGARGWGRIDFMVDSAGDPYLMELNTIPGMTDHSLVPMAAAAAGMSFEDLVLAILASSFTDTTLACHK